MEYRPSWDGPIAQIRAITAGAGCDERCRLSGTGIQGFAYDDGRLRTVRAGGAADEPGDYGAVARKRLINKVKAVNVVGNRMAGALHGELPARISRVAGHTDRPEVHIQPPAGQREASNGENNSVAAVHFGSDCDGH